MVEYGSFERVGGSGAVEVDVRIIGATNADLAAMAARGTFKPDLLDRLSFEVLFLPPLREREEDILLLAGHFASRMAFELGRQVLPVFSPAAVRALEGHGWPGNVRELKNVIQRYLTLGRLEFLAPGTNGSAIPAESDLRLDRALRQLEESLISQALQQAGVNRTRAAALLGISRRALFRKKPSGV